MACLWRHMWIVHNVVCMSRYLAMIYSCFVDCQAQEALEGKAGRELGSTEQLSVEILPQLAQNWNAVVSFGKPILND